MSASKKKTAEKQRSEESVQQLSVRVTADVLESIEEIKRKSGGLATQAKILREALALGLKELLGRFDKR